MKKTYKGWELMKAIAEGEIKNGSRFKDENGAQVKWNGYNLMFIKSGENYMCAISDLYFANEVFELIEDEIDIDNIKEIKTDEICDTTYYINDLIKAVKQINKRLKKLED